uniref:Uncharacterized protein n=1 Tax=Cacopsylla melanoneura TaxID=428564 RepID=A0A8D9BHR2_9HEMI
MELCSKWSIQILAILLVLILHVFVNILNRILGYYMNFSMLWQDACDSPGSDVLSCSLFVFLTLLWLIVCRPKLIRKYGIPLIHAELLLQLLHAIIYCRLFSLRLCDVIPSIGDAGIGCVNIFRVLFALGLIYLTLALVYITMKIIRNILKPESGDDCDTPPDGSGSILDELELLSLLPCCGTPSPGLSRTSPSCSTHRSNTSNRGRR